MKSLKGKILKKLVSIKPATGFLKQDRFLLSNASDGLVENENQKWRKEPEEEVKRIDLNGIAVLQEPEIVDVTELMKSLEDDFMELDKYINQCDKKYIGPTSFRQKGPIFENQNLFLSPEAPRSLQTDKKTLKKSPLSETMSVRKPELSSGGLFRPNLLAAFEQAVVEHTKIPKEIKIVKSEEPPLKVQRVTTEENIDPLSLFDEKCPPGGSKSVILYTTSLRGIRKTFEDCHSIRFLLESFRILFCERDVSIHSKFREELWRVLDSNGKAVVPPRLFIKGRYIGGAEEVLILHEQGKFRPLFDGVPDDPNNGSQCNGCAGFRFVVCFHCNGSHKIIVDDVGSSLSTMVKKNCPHCNENGLIICPICS